MSKIRLTPKASRAAYLSRFEQPRKYRVVIPGHDPESRNEEKMKQAQ
jgi:hypothetical protein